MCPQQYYKIQTLQNETKSNEVSRVMQFAWREGSVFILMNTIDTQSGFI